MGEHLAIRIALTIGFLLLTVPASAAEDCTLKLITSVDTTTAPSGRMAVPVTIAGKSRTMLLDTGGVFSEISPQAADEMNLPRRRTNAMLFDVTGNAVRDIIDVEDFTLGALKASNMQLIVGRGEYETDGILAPNLLQAYDLELDFPHNKLSLISPEHCKGQVIHWPAAAVAIVPMRVTATGHITVPVQVDGHRLEALLDTGAADTVMSLRVATGTFKLTPGEPGVEEVGHLEKAGSKVYEHRFKTLSIEGITVNNPNMVLLPDLTRNFLQKAPPLGTHIPTNDESQGLPDVLIGMQILKHLHIYIAYKEQMLYITAGE